MTTATASDIGKIETNSLEIKRCFTNYRYTLPEIQRSYSWGDQNLSEFWNDITKEHAPNEPSNHFLGATVIYFVEKGDNHPDKYGIIDGQQRLTTSQILLAALRDHIKKLEDEASEQQSNQRRSLLEDLHEQQNITHAYLVRRHEDHGTRYATIDSDDYYYKKVINKTLSIEPRVNTSHNQAIENAYKFFTSQLESTLKELSIENALARIIEIRKKLLTSTIVQIETPNEVSASIIFETLNARGMPLSTEDMIKNLLIRKGAKADEDPKVISDDWKEICRLASELDDEPNPIEAERQPGKFIRHSWFSRYPLTTQRDFYAKVANAFDDGQVKTTDYLRDLHEDYQLYALFDDENITPIKPSRSRSPQEIPEVVDTLRALAIFKVTAHYPLLLSAMRKYKVRQLAKKDLIALCHALEVFYFYSVKDKRNGRIGELFARHALSIYSATNQNKTRNAVNEVIKYLKSRIPSEQAAREQVFRDLFYTNTKKRPKGNTKPAIMRYVLIKMGQHAYKIDRGVPHHVENYSIEHILGDREVNSDGLPLDVHKLGNLTVLNRSVNSTLPDAFSDKREVLRRTVHFIDPILQVWLDEPKASISPDDLEERLNYLTKLAASEIWTI